MKQVYSIIFLAIILCPLVLQETPHQKIMDSATEGQVLDKIAKEILLEGDKDYIIHFTEEKEFEEQEIAYQNVTFKELRALARAPRWIHWDLLHQYRLINEEEYADIILNAEKRQVDELAFSLACSPLGHPPPIEILKNNVNSLYHIDEYLDYVEIIDCDMEDGNYYSTLKYRVKEGNTDRIILCPMEIYYWFVVAPKITTEEPSLIYDTYWRDYIFNHNDLGYPLLKEKLSEINYLWDMCPYHQPANRSWPWSQQNHPTAIEAVSYWIGKAVPFEAYGSRPVQPNIIYHEHNGWCGELQQIAIASLRTALIPTRGICDWGGDHVWREFWERGWHQNDNWWADGGGAVDIPDEYKYGWDKDISTLFAWMGDDSIRETTARYIHETERKNVKFSVVDRNENPIDGVRVTSLVLAPIDITGLMSTIWERLEEVWEKIPEWLKCEMLFRIYQRLEEKWETIPDSLEGFYPSIWNYTNAHGECSLDIGENRSYLFLIQYGNLKKIWQPAKWNTIRPIVEVDKNYSFKIQFPYQGSNRLSNVNNKRENGEYHVSIEFSSQGFQNHNNIMTDNYGKYEVVNMVECFCVNRENFERYKQGKQVTTNGYINNDNGKMIIQTDNQEWYIVFRNPSCVTYSVINFSVEVRGISDKESICLLTVHNGPGGLPIFKIGEKIVMQGYSSENATVKINNKSQYVEKGSWFVTWDTNHTMPGNYSVIACCQNTTDSLSITLVDASPPQIQIINPIKGEIIKKGITTISGVARDEYGVAQVAIETGSIYKIIQEKSVWDIEWDTTNIPPGDYNITVTAIDYAGNKMTKRINVVLNETGHNWSPLITEYYHKPTKPTNQSNIVILANITQSSPFGISTVTIFYTTNNNQTIQTHNMFLYAANPIQDRNDEDPLKDRINAPIYGIELGQFPKKTVIDYWIDVYDTAKNKQVSPTSTITVE